MQKAKPLKKITSDIFANVHAINADANPNVLRLSVDVKAKVAVGEFSLEGRGALPRRAESE